VQLAGNVSGFSYLPPSIDSFDPSRVVLMPAQKEDGSFETATISILGQNFGSSDPAVQNAQGWSVFERVVLAAVGGVDCVGAVNRASLNGVTQLVCDVQSEVMLAGYRNVSITVAGQAGLAPPYSYLVTEAGGRRRTFVPLLMTSAPATTAT